MRKTFFICSTLMVSMLFSCGNKTEKATSVNDSDSIIVDEEVGDEAADVPPMIEGYESAEMSEAGLKAWIKHGIVYWQVSNEDAYKKFVEMSDFVRCGTVGPVRLYLPEYATGVKIARHGATNEKNVGLYIISESGDVYILDLCQAVSGIVTTPGLLSYAHEVCGFNCHKEDDRYVVETQQTDEGSVNVEFYGFNDEEGPLSCSFTVGGKDYILNMESSWSCHLITPDGQMRGSFLSAGDLGGNKWVLTFNEKLEYGENGEVHNPIDAITIYMEWYGGAETIIFGKNPLGIPEDIELPAEILPLYD